MDQDSEKPRSGIKVVDRRRFDSAGTEKPDDARSEDSQAKKISETYSQPQHPLVDLQPAAFEGDQLQQSSGYHQSADQEYINDLEINQEINSMEDNNIQDDSDISFGSFVISMATQALMLMGQLPAPDGMPLAVDPAAAKQTIDILTMLNAKTKGNLNPQEDHLIKDALHNLRMAYLKFK